MAKIKFKPIIKDPAEFQQGDLPENATKVAMPETTGKMMLLAMPFCIILIVILMITMWTKRLIYDYAVINPLFLAVGFVFGALLLWVHEILHAIVYPKGATVTVGFYPKGFAFVALASYPLKRSRFVLMSLLPFVLGLVPLACFIFFPYYWSEVNGVMFGLALMGTISPYPDCYNVWQVLRKTPKGSYIQFYGDDLYYFTADTVETEVNS